MVVESANKGGASKSVGAEPEELVPLQGRRGPVSLGGHQERWHRGSPGHS